MKKVSKTYERMGDEDDKTEFDGACALFQDLRSDLKSLHRMKYDLYIEGSRTFFKFANMKRNSGYPSTMFFESQSGRGPEEVVNLFAEFFQGVYMYVRVSPFRCSRSTLCRMKSMSRTRYLLSSPRRQQLRRPFWGWINRRVWDLSAFRHPY
jgi:hypothetical protein